VLQTQAVIPVEISFDIFVLAYSDLQIRLVNPINNKTAGRVEIYHPSFGWGTICVGLPWTKVEGGVVCRQLNFTGANAANSNSYGGGSGPILLYIIKCTGNESYIWECSHRGWNVYAPYCATHSNDAGVDCY
jgi:deleted-in-malignant-brain-tumors protein 1